MDGRPRGSNHCALRARAGISDSPDAPTAIPGVIPAKAEPQALTLWVPAFAGMTAEGVWCYRLTDAVVSSQAPMRGQPLGLVSRGPEASDPRAARPEKAPSTGHRSFIPARCRRGCEQG